jgi:uncharacterized protein YndB with AHSA1/START domain
MTDTPTQPANEERVLVITRTLNAPRALVWRAFSDPVHLSRWWGPAGFTNPVCELDFRVGGHWHNVMRGPDGSEYPTDFTFVAIVAPEHIVLRNAPARGEVWGDNPPPSFERSITFEDLGGTKTLLTIRAEFGSLEHKDAVVRRGWIAGTNESFDKLEALLAEEAR